MDNNLYVSNTLIENKVYTRNMLRAQFQIFAAGFKNGVFRSKESPSIWLFVTEKKTKDATPFNDYLVGDHLYWDGQSQGGTDKLIIEHQANNQELIVFFRKNKHTYPEYGFMYLGRFHYVSHSGGQPTHFVLKKEMNLAHIVEEDILALQIEEGNPPLQEEKTFSAKKKRSPIIREQLATFSEGKVSQVLVNKQERNPRLRRRAIEIHGTSCQVCGFSFKNVYGGHGENFIEVHHLNPISQYEGEQMVDPDTDMAVLCSNCHRMIHRKALAPLTLDALRQLIQNTHPSEEK